MSIWTNARMWAFVADMNGDGVVTISDVWLWFEWLYFYPGDGVVWVVGTALPAAARFLEVTPASYGAASGSGIISLLIWGGLILSILDELSLSPVARAQREEELALRVAKEKAELEAAKKGAWYRRPLPMWLTILFWVTLVSIPSLWGSWN